MELRLSQGLAQTPGAQQVRQAVFVEEQGFSLPLEFDETDRTAWHAVLWENGVPLATGRTFPCGEETGVYAIGRVAVCRAARGRGLGTAIMLGLESQARALGASAVSLCAQVRARGFYETLGYAAYGEIVFDESVPHVMMKKNL